MCKTGVQSVKTAELIKYVKLDLPLSKYIAYPDLTVILQNILNKRPIELI